MRTLWHAHAHHTHTRMFSSCARARAHAHAHALMRAHCPWACARRYLWFKPLRADIPTQADPDEPDPVIEEVVRGQVVSAVEKALLEARGHGVGMWAVCVRHSPQLLELEVVCTEGELDPLTDCLAVLDHRFAYGSPWCSSSEGPV